jgi:hypothetical protein
MSYYVTTFFIMDLNKAQFLWLSKFVVIVLISINILYMDQIEMYGTGFSFINNTNCYIDSYEQSD